MHFPTWPYDSSNITDDVEVFIDDLDDVESLEKLYEIKEDNETVSYTCPIGWIFKGNEFYIIHQGCRIESF